LLPLLAALPCSIRPGCFSPASAKVPSSIFFISRFCLRWLLRRSCARLGNLPGAGLIFSLLCPLFFLDRAQVPLHSFQFCCPGFRSVRRPSRCHSSSVRSAFFVHHWVSLKSSLSSRFLVSLCSERTPVLFVFDLLNWFLPRVCDSRIIQCQLPVVFWSSAPAPVGSALRRTLLQFSSCDDFFFARFCHQDMIVRGLLQCESVVFLNCQIKGLSFLSVRYYLVVGSRSYTPDV
jgi:hypothetical protein